MEPGCGPVTDVAELQREIAALKAQRAAEIKAAEIKTAEEKWSALSRQHEAERNMASDALRAFQLQWLDETLKDTGIKRKGFELLDSTAQVCPTAQHIPRVYGARVAKISAMLKSLGEQPIAVAVKYLTYCTVVDGTVALHLQKYTYHQYSVVVGVITNKSIYYVQGIHNIWLTGAKYPENGIWHSVPPVSPPPQGCGYEQHDLDKQTLAPVYTFDPPLTAETAAKVQKVCNLVLGRIGNRFQTDPTTDMHIDLLLHRIAPGKYENGSYWERLGGFFGPYYNKALNEWRADPPPLESPSTTPSGALVFRYVDVAQPEPRMSLAAKLQSGIAAPPSDDVPPPSLQRDAAYVYKNKIDRISAEIVTVERDLRASAPGPLLKKVATLREALAKRHEAHRYLSARERSNAFGPNAPGYCPLSVAECTLLMEHPEKVREADAEISTNLDLIGKYSELQEKLAKLTAMRNQLRSEQQRLIADAAAP